MITKVRFVRDENGRPQLVLFMKRHNRIKGHNRIIKGHFILEREAGYKFKWTVEASSRS